MLPDLVKYLFGISRLIVCIALILLGAGLLGVVTSWRAREKLRAEKSKSGGEQSDKDEADTQAQS